MTPGSTRTPSSVPVARSQTLTVASSHCPVMSVRSSAVMSRWPVARWVASLRTSLPVGVS